MKWAATILLLLCLVVPAAEPNKCVISDFYGLSWLFNPSNRHQELSRWLTTNGDNCTAEQLVTLWNMLPSWAGVADSAELRSKILYYYSRAVEREKK